MNKELLKSRIKANEEKIVKKENLIQKRAKLMAKTQKELKEKYGVEDWKTYKRTNEDDTTFWNIYWTTCNMRDYDESMGNAAKEIIKAREIIQKCKEQLRAEEEKERTFLTEIPESMKSMQTELVKVWDDWDKERHEFIKDRYEKLGYREFMKTYNVTSYELMKKSFEEIHEDNVKSAKFYILDLYRRIKDITGEVEKWDCIRLTYGNGGCPVLNGIVNGKKGGAKVESIGAGGYNIQRYHIRTLVKPW